MVLALVDDLMFRSKIKATAQQAGATVSFAGSRDAALSSMRASTPTLVIFDLNNTRADPLGTLAEMQKDAALAAVPTIGYVSHVDTATIEAARAAGVGDVVARSGFTTRLAELLAR